MSHTLIIGLAPDANDCRCTRELASLCDMTLSDFLWGFDRVEACDVHEDIEVSFGYDKVLLLGQDALKEVFSATHVWPWALYQWHRWGPAGKACVVPPRITKAGTLEAQTFWRELARAER